MTKAPIVSIRSKPENRIQDMADFSFTWDQSPDFTHSGLKQYQQAAWEAYREKPFPGLQDEAWRRTDIRNLDPAAFTLNQKQTNYPPPPRLLLDPIIPGETYAGKIVSGAVQTAWELDPALAEKGVVFTGLKYAGKHHADLLNRCLGQIVRPDEDKFTALAAALASDGVFLYVPSNVIIHQPLHSLYWGAGENMAYLNHLLIWVEDGAQVTFVHESASPPPQSGARLFHDGIVEIHVGKNARLNFVELQSWGRNVWSFTRERANVLASGSLEWIFGAMGSHLTKNFSDINLLEPGAEGRMSGFYFASGDQHLDHDTQQNHMAVNTTSDLLYKGALMDESRSVWQGMIYVAPGAFGTDGYQANRNLILSKGARADSIPGLEILADDVRCTHGATVGKIDENELFYLLSRGIPRKEAEQLIVAGFFAPIMERIPFEGVRNRFENAILEKMADR